LPKIVKIPLITLAALLMFALVFLAFAQTKWFKNYATDKATRFLSTELGVTVSIREIELNYFDALTAHDLYIEDQQHDTMIYIAKLAVNYDLFGFSNAHIQLDEVTIQNAKVYLGIHKGAQDLNLQFLIDYFTPPRSIEPSQQQIITFDKVELANTVFAYFNKNYSPPSSRAFDENNMVFKHINGHLHNFNIINDSLRFIIENLSGTEKSGLQIDRLTAKSIISSTTMRFEDLELKTPKSHVKEYLEFNYTSYGDFSDFIDVVSLKANFKDASIHTDDIALFSTNVATYNEQIRASGKVFGTIASMRSNRLKLAIGSHTRFVGSAHLIGLPDIETTVFNINAKSLTTTAIDLARIAEINPAPKEFLNLGQISYQGTFNGLLTDFTTDAEIGTDVGSMTAQVHYTLLANNNATYAGEISSTNLDLEMLLGQRKLGTTAFDLSLNGSGLTFETLKSNVEGTISQFTFGGYQYQNMRVNGDVSNSLFNGKFDIQDPNFNFNFNGTLDASKQIPEIAVKANVFGINLRLLGLDNIDNFVKFTGDINLAGDNLDNLSGTVQLDSFNLLKEGRNYQIKDILLAASLSENQRNYKLISDLAQINIEGDFYPSESEDLIEFVKHIIYPSQFSKPEKILSSKDVRVAITINQFQPVFKEFLGVVRFDRGSLDVTYNHFLGQINGENNLVNLSYDAISSPFVSLSLKNGGGFAPINFGINTGGLRQNDSAIFNILNAHGFVKDGEVIFETTSKKDDVLDIALAGRFVYRNDSALIFLDNTKVDIYTKSWELKKTTFPNIIYSNNVTEFRYFDFRNGAEILFLDASIGQNANKLNANLSKFKLANLTPFLAGYGIKLEGTTNGYIDVSDRDGFPIIETDLMVANLQLDQDTLGDLKLLSTSKDNLLAVDIDGKIKGGLLNDMEISGDINFDSKQSPLNLQLTTQTSSIKPFERYLTGLASQISGFSTSKISISGPLASPKLRGTMQLDSLDFLVDYMQTHYTGSATVDIDYSSFSLRKSEITDRFGKKAVVVGEVTHRSFQDFIFNLNFKDLYDFEIMNTRKEDNDLFYGTAFVDGNMEITGPLDDILLTINAKSRKGTEIVIPLETSESSGKLSYVQFVNLKTDNNAVSNTLKSQAGVRMDFNFEITNDANIKMVFDELLGDKIEAAGHGNLRMEINTYGDFNMYGGLTIDRGNYLFTALDLINKYFTVKQGGTLLWDGNPYNARINLEAIKREYPVPSTLMTGTVSAEELEAYNQAIPVDCNLKLTGLLFNPIVNFDLNFPTQNSLSGSASSALNTVIDRIKLDQEELDRQVFALLVLGTFIPPSFSSASSNSALVEAGAANTGINSLSDFASSQLNNWLGKLDTRWQVGVDYQSTYKSQAELILSLRRKIWNDRLEVSFSVDAVTSENRPYDISVKYDINEDGSLKVRGFQKQANDPTLGNITNVNTTGVGLYYRYQFDNFHLRKRKKDAPADKN
jgi:hypothetical protein